MSRGFGSIASFISLGMLLVLIVVGVVLFSWLLLLGAITGLFLYGLMWIKKYFFTTRRDQPLSGRIIEHDDIDRHR